MGKHNNSSLYKRKTRNVFKKTNGVGLKKEKKYLYINLTQMTENLE